MLFGCSSIPKKKISRVDTKQILDIDSNKSCEELSIPKQQIQIYDLENIPQDVSYYSKNISTPESFYEIQKEYEKSYFNIWNINESNESLESIKWPFASYCLGKSYGENLQLLDKKFFDEMLSNSNFNSYSTINKKAVTLKETNIRAFPTIKPLLMDPTLAGEGFPFDYLQNSTIHANKPIFLSHYSEDKEWAYVFSSFTSGWIKSDEFVILNREDTKTWQNAQQVKIIEEDISIFDNKNNFLFKSKIGMMFPLISEDDKSYTILTISTYKNSKPLYIESKIPKNIAYKGILELNSDNINSVVNEVTNSNYGWGGMYGQRDCSSMLRDMFAPFGIWLPRNSYQQSKVGNVISLEGLSDTDKIALIKEKAVAFQTLLYKKGHIVLYVGTHNDEIVVLHNTWGIKTKKGTVEGRVVIGKPVFSSLRLGKNQKNYDEEAEILRNLKSMNTITQ